MSVIQQIQEKYAKLMAVVIAVALIIFVVMLAFENGGSLFSGGRSNSVGSVNGKSISFDEFAARLDLMESRYEQQYGPNATRYREMALSATWSQVVDEIVLNSELNKLGIEVSKKEMGDMLYGANAPEEFKRAFTDTATGQFNPQAAKGYIDNLLRLKRGTQEQLVQRQQLVNYINDLERARLGEKYAALFRQTVNYPKWLIEQENADNSLMAKVSYVKESYTSIPDSTITVTEKEISDYLSKHKDEFKQEESRTISYVAFNIVPSAEDTATAMRKIVDLKTDFDTTKDVKRFLSSQGIDFVDNFLKKEDMPASSRDSVLQLSAGGVYGPYLEGNSYTLAKLLGTRHQADSATVRHILIETHDRSGQQTRDTLEAKNRADSVAEAIRNGANFDTLCMKLSDDGGKFDQVTGQFTGGVYKNIKPNDSYVAPFLNFIFGHSAGYKGVVKTQFGYHYIEILSQMGPGATAYNVAYLSKPIEPSQETYNNYNNEATLFAGDSRDQKSFEANAEKKQDNPRVSRNSGVPVQRMAFSVSGLAPNRSFIKSIFDAKRGEVLQPEKVGEAFVVAIVTGITEEGTMSAANARSRIEPILKREKAGKILAAKIGTPTTLEAAAAAWGGKPIEVADSLRMPGAGTSSNTQISREPKVIGAALNPGNKGKVIPVVIEGNQGVYVVRVDDVTTTPLGVADVEEQRKSRYQQSKQTVSAPLQALKEAGNVKDRRNRFF